MEPSPGPFDGGPGCFLGVEMVFGDGCQRLVQDALPQINTASPLRATGSNSGRNAPLVQSNSGRVARVILC